MAATIAGVVRRARSAGRAEIRFARGSVKPADVTEVRRRLEGAGLFVYERTRRDGGTTVVAEAAR